MLNRLPAGINWGESYLQLQYLTYQLSCNNQFVLSGIKRGIRVMFKNSLHTLSLILFVIGINTLTFGAEDYSDWDFSQKVLLNTSGTGAYITGDVHKFPVLLRLFPENFGYFAQTYGGGADIRFAKTNGVHLPYQIEKWVDGPSDKDTALIWVLLDTIRANNATQSFVMYWGKDDAADSSNSTAVFENDNGFTGTYHLAGNLEDATGNGNDGNDQSTGTVDEPDGVIGSARSFNGSQYFHIGQQPVRSQGTISCWIRLDDDFDNSSAKTQGIWAVKRNDSYNASLGFRGTDYTAGNEDRTGAIQTKAEYDNTSVYLAGETNSFDADRWYYVTWVWGNQHEYLYLNDALDSEIDASQSVGTTNSAYDVIGACFFDSVNINDKEIRYFRGAIDEFRLESTGRPAQWVSLSYHNQKPSQSLVTTSGTFTWDSDAASGIQPDDGTWGTDNFWTINETQLTSWPGRGFTARFDGDAGTYDVTIAGTQDVDSIAFLTSTFTLSGGTIDFGTANGAISLNGGVTAHIGTELTGSSGLTISKGSGSSGSYLYLEGVNTYSGVTSLPANMWCNVSVIADGGTACALGTASSAASNLVFDGGTLQYVGSDDATTDRLFTVTANGAHIYVSGNGALDFTNTDPIVFSDDGDHTVEFGGLIADRECTFAPEISDATDGATSVIKTGVAECIWVFTADHTYTGTTNVSNGTLIVNGALDAASTVTVDSDAAIGGTGIIGGAIAAAGKVEPGHNGPGKLTTGNLVLGSSSVLDFELGTASDSLVVSGDLSLNGTLNITAGAGFALGVYQLISCSGNLTDNTLQLGTLPPGYNGILQLTDSTVSILFTSGLIQEEPADVTVNIGEEAGFSVSAIGSGDLTYKWIQLPDDSVGNSATFTIDAVTMDDNDTRFQCIVTDESSSTDTSRIAHLTVIDLPHITAVSESMSVYIGDPATFSVTMADTSLCTYEWRKDDLSDAVATVNPCEISSATIDDAGNYYCRVTNPAGSVVSDTIHLSVAYPPPAARFTFSPTEGRVPLEISFYDSSTGNINSRHWDFGDGDTDTTTNPKHTYDRSGFYTVTLIVSGLGGNDTLIKTDSITVNGSKNNPLVIEGFLLEDNNVEITISNIDLIDTTAPEPWCDSIGVWIAPDTLPENLADAILLESYTRSDFTGSILIDTLLFPSTDSVYGVVAGIFWQDGTVSDVLAKNGMLFDLRDTAKQANPLSIHAEAGDNMEATITITNVSRIDTSAPSPYCDSIGVWVSPVSLPTTPDDAILYRRYPRTQFTGDTITDILSLPATDSVYGVMTALFYDDGTVSTFFTRNGAIVDFRDTTKPPDTIPTGDSTLTGAVRITSLAFDSSSGTIHVAWCLDSMRNDDLLEVGIQYSLEAFPLRMSGGQTVTVLDSCTDTLLKLSEAVLFDTTYFVALFIRRQGGEWTAGDSGSRGKVHTAKLFRQVTTYFDREAQTDSVYVFNNNIVLWKDESIINTSTTTDTLEVYAPELQEGFIAVGTGVTFVEAKNRPPFYIGFNVTLPDGRSINEVRIYRDSAGVLLVDYETRIDTINNRVYTTASNLGLPLIPLIDIIKPSAEFITDINATVTIGADLIDSVRLSDNVANLQWKYLYSRADAPPVVRDSNTLTETSATRALTIFSNDKVISSDYGFRALFVISDGVYNDTFNLSRPVHRDDSDPQQTLAMTWQPIYSTARLHNEDPEGLIISKIDANIQDYNPRIERLFRWVETKENHSDLDDKWVEYDPSVKETRSLFSLVPGRLLWLKTRNSVGISFGEAETFSMKDTVSITLPAHQFTDFGMPFRFGVTLNDIFSASSDEAESVHILEWVKDENTGHYRSDVIYMAGNAEKQDQSVQMKYKSGGGYCIYNPLSSEVQLRIPPALGTTSSTILTKKKQSGDWCTRLTAVSSNGYRFPDVYCGYANGLSKSIYPIPPSFEKVRISIYDRETGKKQAHYFSEDATTGVIKEILFSNQSDSAVTIHFNVATAGSLPDRFSADMYDNTVNKFLTSGTVTVEAHTTASRWLTSGDRKLREDFLSGFGNFQYRLHRIYPNPARALLHISYSVPFGAMEHLNISIYDLRGRKIWDKMIEKLLTPGNHVTTWNGRNRHGTAVSAGMYTILFSVSDQKGKAVRRFKRIFTYLP